MTGAGLMAGAALLAQTGHGLGIWDMVSHADLLVKTVLLGLILFSVVSWTIIITKLRGLAVARRADAGFEEVFGHAESLSSVFTRTRGMTDSPMAAVFRTGYEEVRRLLSGQGSMPSARTDGVIENLERALARGRTTEMTRLEGSASVLASAANTAPFIGLFGTVWGIMNSFRAIGAAGAANLATVAPGIAEALIATATGLFVAIPAAFFFNHITRRLQIQDEKLSSFSQEMLNVVASDLLRGNGPGA